MTDCLVSSVIYSMATLIIWIVEDSGELMAVSLNYAVTKCFNTTSIKAVGLRLCIKVKKGKCIIVCCRSVIRVVVTVL